MTTRNTPTNSIWTPISTVLLVVLWFALSQIRALFEEREGVHR